MPSKSMIPRTLFTAEHEPFRNRARRVIEQEVLPNHAVWKVHGVAPHEIWRMAGPAAGLLCPALMAHCGGGAEEVMCEPAAR